MVAVVVLVVVVFVVVVVAAAAIVVAAVLNGIRHKHASPVSSSWPFEGMQ